MTDETLNGCILISMFSASCTSRDKDTPNLPPNKMLPWPKWKPMLNFLRESFPDTPIRFIGAPTDFVPNGYASDITRPGEYMLGIPLNTLALLMQKAKLLVTIDNGMSHLGASQETPTYLMYPRCLGTHYILPIGNPNLTYVHMDPVHVNPAQLLKGLQFTVGRLKC
jgi:ADP-heptose:LPS heptosyltransferase